jgi:hypothetical protein
MAISSQILFVPYTKTFNFNSFFSELEEDYSIFSIKVPRTWKVSIGWNEQKICKYYNNMHHHIL